MGKTIIQLSKLLGNYNSNSGPSSRYEIIQLSKLLGNYNWDGRYSPGAVIIQLSKLLGNYNLYNYGINV